MLQRITLFSIIVLLFITFITMFFFLKKEANKIYTDTFRAVPVNTEIFFYTKDSKELLNLLISKDKPIVNALFKLDISEKLIPQLEVIDSLAKNNEYFNKFITNRELSVAFSVKGMHKISLLFILPLNSITEQKFLNKSILQLQNKYNYKIRKRRFNENDLFTLYKQNKKNEFTYCIIDNLFFLSASSLLVEDAVLQLPSAQKITSDKNFQELKKTILEESTLHCFINHKNFPNLATTYLKKDIRTFIENNRFLSWTALDIEVKENHLLLNGFTKINAKENVYLNILANQKELDFQLDKVIPANCIGYTTLVVGSVKKFRENFKANLEKTREIHQYNKTNYEWNKQAGMNIESFMDNLIKNEMCAVFLEDIENNVADNSFMVMKTKGNSFAKGQLEKLLKNYAKSKKIDAKNYITQNLIDRNNKYTFYQIPFKNFAYQYWGNFFKNISTNYVALYENYLIAGNSRKALQKFIYHNLLRKTLSNDEFYKFHKKYISDKNINFSIYLNLMNGLNWQKSLLSRKKERLVSKYKRRFEKFQTLSYQVSNTGDYLYNHIYFSYNDNVKIKPETTWESILDADVIMKPALVINHNTKEKEIIIQDISNKIYLINKTGLIIWKNQLKEPINSEIYQVDYYKNDKYQYLFSTKSQLHLIDRKGNYVERYPINLKQNSTAGMALFDYENNKNYRILIPCKNKKIYAYNLKGNIVVGWKFKKTDFVVKTPIQHFRLKNKDYIVCGDNSRTYILDRKGNERVSLKKRYGKSTNNAYTLDEMSKRLISTTPNGLIVYNYFNGNVEVKFIEKKSTKHFFASADMNKDNAMDFIFVDKNQLKVYNSDGTKLFEKYFNKTTIFPPKLYEMSYNLHKIGITDNDNIYLFNNKGKQHFGFPLQGKTNFSIGLIDKNSKQFSLFVIGKGNSLYNYTIE